MKTNLLSFMYFTSDKAIQSSRTVLELIKEMLERKCKIAARITLQVALAGKLKRISNEASPFRSNRCGNHFEFSTFIKKSKLFIWKERRINA